MSLRNMKNTGKIYTGINKHRKTYITGPFKKITKNCFNRTEIDSNRQGYSVIIIYSEETVQTRAL